MGTQQMVAALASGIVMWQVRTLQELGPCKNPLPLLSCCQRCTLTVCGECSAFLWQFLFELSFETRIWCLSSAMVSLSRL